MMIVLATGLGASAQDIGGIISAGVTTVIRAVDLQIQRIQTRTIVLQEAQKAVENAMSALELDDIRNWVEQQKDLYAGYFQELWQVKTVISGYHRVSEAIRRQEAIVAAYRRGLGQFRQDAHFSAAELNEIEAVFDGILADSEKNLEQLTKAVAAFSLQATDQQRMAMIDAAADGMDHDYRDLQRYTQQNQLLSLQRAKDESDYSFILKLYTQ
ncbi:hypothetical protein GCM10011511_49780 [Puia dinghuensis]|uniref:Conjugal transfer protein TrbJ n=2 Tax=Puia dinghuensis TaxID=1792502 RepID=A0A8J2UHX1_9BACT|nr:hypothetical protein GCM10011511_49780 [Puia dinghuensis]